MEPYVTAIITTALTAITSAVVGYLVARLKTMEASRNHADAEREKRDRAMEEGIKALLRRELDTDYHRHCVDGEPLNATRRSEIEQEYKAYQDLGGNGTGHHMWQAISELPISD